MSYYGIVNNTLYIGDTATTEATISFTSVTSGTWPWDDDNIKDTFSKVIIQNTFTPVALNYIFRECTNIKTIEGLANIDTSGVTTMMSAFQNCESLIDIDLNDLKVDNIQIFTNAFANCYNLKSVKIDKWNVSNATTLAALFNNCPSLKSFDGSSWQVNGSIPINAFFNKCSSLEYVNFANWQISGTINSVFIGCSSLKYIYCNNAWTATAGTNTFQDCTSLKGAIAYDSTKTDYNYASPAGYFTPVPSRISSGTMNNLLPKAINTDGSIYGSVGKDNIDYTGKGYRYGYYLSSRDGSETAFWDDVYITGYMPCQLSDIVYLKNCVWDINHTNKGYFRVAYYDSSFNYIGVMASAGMVGATGGVVDANNILLQFTVKAVNGAQLTSNVAYFRICTPYLGPDSIITVNNPINIVDDNYSVLSCFGSTGTQYIDTGFNPNQNTRAIMDVSVITQSKESALLGARHAYANTSFDLFIKSTGFQDDYANSAVSVTYSPVSSTRLIIDKNKNVLSVNESAIRTATATTFSCSYPIHLLSINNAGTAMASSYPTIGTLYSCQIYDSNAIVRDYVTVKTSDGTVGLYDKANGVLYTNAGTGSFAEGSATGETIGLEVDSFEVKQEDEYIKLGNSVPLSWHSFNSVDSYVIERSVNEEDYEVVYTGTPYTSTGYSTNDSPNETGIVQYRAKVVKGDLSSEYVYSNPYIVYAVSTYENLIVGGVL